MNINLWRISIEGIEKNGPPAPIKVSLRNGRFVSGPWQSMSSTRWGSLIAIDDHGLVYLDTESIVTVERDG